MATIEQYLHNLYRAQPDFLYSVSRDFARSCRTPLLVLPDETPAHPLQASRDVAALAPNAQSTVFPWKEPPELKARTIEQVRRSCAPISRRRRQLSSGLSVAMSQDVEQSSARVANIEPPHAPWLRRRTILNGQSCCDNAPMYLGEIVHLD